MVHLVLYATLEQWVLWHTYNNVGKYNSVFRWHWHIRLLYARPDATCIQCRLQKRRCPDWTTAQSRPESVKATSLARCTGSTKPQSDPESLNTSYRPPAMTLRSGDVQPLTSWNAMTQFVYFQRIVDTIFDRWRTFFRKVFQWLIIQWEFTIC